MIKTERVIIRSIRREDLSLLMEWNSQASRGDFQEFHFGSVRDLEKRYDADAFNSEHFKILLFENRDSEALGLIYISFVREGLVRLGVVICNPEGRGKGYGKEVTSFIVRYLFMNYPLIRVEAETDIENQAAQKVLIHAGFVKEGVLRKFRYHHGQWRDFVLFSILKDEVLYS